MCRISVTLNVFSHVSKIPCRFLKIAGLGSVGFYDPRSVRPLTGAEEKTRK